jgi:mRNA interferase MazF
MATHRTTYITDFILIFVDNPHYVRYSEMYRNMGHYARGDVILTRIPIDDRGEGKVRPAIVVAVGDGGFLFVCPVSSKPPSDAPSHPLTIDDFASGGLDLFAESYVMTTRVRTIRNGDVIGKRGTLEEATIASINSYIPVFPHTGNKSGAHSRNKERD